MSRVSAKAKDDPLGTGLMKINWKISGDKKEEMQRLQALLSLDTVEELMAQAVWLLQWVVNQKQKGMALAAIHEESNLVRMLEMPVLERVEVDPHEVSPSQFPYLVAEQVREMVEQEHIEEAIDAAEVVKRFKASQPPSSRFPPPSEPARVKSAMNLEAAKIMAEEGAPGVAVRLVKEVCKERQFSKKRVGRKKPQKSKSDKKPEG